MAISYVGGQSAGRTNATAALSVNFALSGGTNATPQSGDFVIVCCVTGSAAGNPAMAVTTPAGYTALGQLNQSATTADTSLNVSYKRMTATPDTAVTIPGTTSNAWGEAYSIQVFRGVDSVNPLDVTSVSAGATATGRPNPGSITPITPGAYVVICAGGAAATGAVYTAPANYTTNFETKVGSDTTSAMVGSGYRAWTSGAEDPAVYTGGTTGATDSWASYTLALRPGQPFLGSPANLEIAASHTAVKVENLGFVTAAATNLLLLYATTGDLLRNGIDWPNPIVPLRAAQPPAIIPNLLTTTLGFPQQPILDTFNRANENPLSGGGNWVTATDTYGSPLILTTNRAGTPASIGFYGSFWSRPFDANFEVYVSVPVLPATPSSGNIINLDFTLTQERPDNLTGSNRHGYTLSLVRASTGAWTLYFTRVDGTLTVSLGIDNVSISFSAGDAFGVQQSGTTYSVYTRNSGTWTRVGSATDATYAGPLYATLGVQDLYGSPPGAARFDDFGGGPLATILSGVGTATGSSTATADAWTVATKSGDGAAAGSSTVTATGTDGGVTVRPFVRTDWPNPVLRTKRQQPTSFGRALTTAPPDVMRRGAVHIPRPRLRYPVLYDFPNLVISTLAPSSTFGAGTATGSSTVTGDGRAVAASVGSAAGSSTVLGAAGISAPASTVNVSVPSATVTPVVSLTVAATTVNVTVPAATVTPVVSLSVAAPVINVTVPSAPALKLTIPVSATVVNVTVPSAPAINLTIPMAAPVINVTVPAAVLTLTMPVTATVINVSVPAATVTAVISLSVTATVVNVTVPAAVLKLTIPTAATVVNVTVPSAVVTLTMPVSATVVNVTVPSAPALKLTIPVSATVVNVTVPTAVLTLTIPTTALLVNVSVPSATVTAVISLPVSATVVNVTAPTPTVTPGAVNVSAPAPVVNVSVPTATVAGAGQVAAPEAIINVSVPSATMRLTLPVTALVVNVSVPAATMTLTIPVTALLVNVSVPSATVTSAVSVSVAAPIINASVPTAAITLGQAVAAPASVINVSVPDAVLRLTIPTAATVVNVSVPTATVTAVVSVTAPVAVVNVSVPAATVVGSGALIAAAAVVNVSISTATVTIAPITRAATAAPVDVSVPTAARLATISLSIAATLVNVTTPNAARVAVISLPMAATTVNVTVPAATVTAGAVSRPAPAPVVNVTAPTAIVGAITVDVSTAIVSVTIPTPSVVKGGVTLPQVATQVAVTVPAASITAVVSRLAPVALTNVTVPVAVPFGYVSLTTPATVVQVSVPLAGRITGPATLTAGTVVLVSVAYAEIVMELRMDELLVTHGRLISSRVDGDFLSAYVLDELMTL